MENRRDKSSFNKVFNIGLPLQTNRNEFYDFISSYKEYIHSIYFSLPLGDRFHTREIICNQFKNEETINLFWDLLKMVQEAGIKLELLFNTYHLTDNDFIVSQEMIQRYNIHIDFVALLDSYYNKVKELFPAATYVYSFNNFYNFKSSDTINKIVENYDYCVLGRSHIRNNDLFKMLSSNGVNVVLLLNNGCSFNCLTCRKSNLCNAVFLNNLKEYDINYLYALQSVMPFELHNGIINKNFVKLYKIASRSGDIDYLKKCMDSYINNRTFDYINESPQNYLLWCRLRHIGAFADNLDIKEILANKESIIGRPIGVIK